MTAARSVCFAALGLACASGCGLSTRDADEVDTNLSTSPASSARPARVPVEARFESHVVYLGLTVKPSKLAPGTEALVTQYWRLDAPLSAAERVQRGNWHSFLRLEGPYGRGTIEAVRRAPKAALPLGDWPVDGVVTEEFAVRVPEDWSEGAVWLFAGISAAGPEMGAPYGKGPPSLKVVRGPDEDGERIRALTMRVKLPHGRAPGWAKRAGLNELGQLVE
jgi:hypothetical protein